MATDCIQNGENFNCFITNVLQLSVWAGTCREFNKINWFGNVETTVYSYYSVFILQCIHTTVYTYYSVYILQCIYTTVYTYYSVYILQCIHTTVYTYCIRRQNRAVFEPRITMVVLSCKSQKTNNFIYLFHDRSGNNDDHNASETLS